MTTKLASFGNYGLHVIQYPSGRWGYVGTIPEALCIEKNTIYGPTMNSRVFDTMQEAIDFYNQQFPS